MGRILHSQLVYNELVKQKQKQKTYPNWMMNLVPLHIDLLENILYNISKNINNCLKTKNIH